MKIKKILLILMSINILIFGMTVSMQNAHAEVITKVATSAAKKAAKELIQDSAVQMAMDIVFNYEMQDMMKDDYKKPNDGYKAVCMEKSGDKCVKPMQVKNVWTATDKKTLGKTVETVLDKKVGMNGWKKFLDWFVPVFLVSAAITWISTLLDDETEDLFSEVAKESLFDLDFIGPIAPVIPENLSPEGIVPEVIPVDGVTPIPIPAKPTTFVINVGNQPAKINKISMSGRMASNNSALVIDFASNVQGSVNLFDSIEVDDSSLMFSANQNNLMVLMAGFRDGYGLKNYYNNLAVLNDVNYKLKYTSLAQMFFYGPYAEAPLSDLVSQSQFWDLKRIILNTHRLADGFAYTIYWILRDGRVLSFPSQGVKTPTTIKANEALNISIGNKSFEGYDGSVRISYYPNANEIDLKPFKPELDDLDLFTLDTSVFKNIDGTVKIIPPSVIPITTPTGISVKPNPKSPTGWTNTVTGEDINVVEDDLIVGDPVPTPDGTGLEQVIPSVPPIKLPQPTPGKDETEKDEEYESCSKDLEKINFNVVGQSFTHAFPFSIPWDLKRMIDNAFDGVEDEKPSVKLSFLGDNVVLSVPDFIDNWMPFARNLMIAMFDISILYMFYRFMRGGGD